MPPLPHDHLDDDALSALVDARRDPSRGSAGDPTVADPASRAEAGDTPPEVAGCSECTERWVAVLDAVDAVGAPVEPLSASTTDAWIAAALDGAERHPRGTSADDTTTSGARVGATDRARAKVVPLRRRRVSTPPATWLVAAAAIFALVLGVPAVLQMSGDDGSSTALVRNATGGEAGGGTEALSAPAEDSSTLSDDSFESGDFQARKVVGLGPIDDPDELVRRLIAVLSAGQGGDEAVTTGGSAAGGSTGGGSGGPSGAGDAAVSASPAQRGADNSDTSPGPAPACEQEARAIGVDRLGSLTYTAGVTWQGEPATVLVFQLTEPSGGDTRQAYVMGQPGCSLLADPRF